MTKELNANTSLSYYGIVAKIGAGGNQLPDMQSR